MAWTTLIIAGLFEIIAVIGLKRVAKKNNFINNVILFAGFIISFYLLSLAMQHISLATAYAVWTGIGTLGTAIVGMVFYRESRKPWRLACILGIVVATIGLKFFG
jgi:paired small multidrug resistance pump